MPQVSSIASYVSMNMPNSLYSYILPVDAIVGLPPISVNNIKMFTRNVPLNNRIQCLSVSARDLI